VEGFEAMQHRAMEILKLPDGAHGFGHCESHRFEVERLDAKPLDCAGPDLGRGLYDTTIQP
jgi:hypothetical protein